MSWRTAFAILLAAILLAAILLAAILLAAGLLAAGAARADGTAPGRLARDGAAAIPAASHQAAAIPAAVVAVYDGDTMTVDARVWPGLTVRATVRLRGLDAPEIRGRCPAEIAAAAAARDRLAALAGDTVWLAALGTDKYGRTLARVLSPAGADLAAVLIAEGLARPYDGGRRAGWCD